MCIQLRAPNCRFHALGCHHGDYTGPVYKHGDAHSGAKVPASLFVTVQTYEASRMYVAMETRNSLFGSEERLYRLVGTAQPKGEWQQYQERQKQQPNS